MPLVRLESTTPLSQGWAENSTPGIYWWNLPVFPGMANKAQVVYTGEYWQIKLFCREILANMILSCKMQQISLYEVDLKLYNLTK